MMCGRVTTLVFGLLLEYSEGVYLYNIASVIYMYILSTSPICYG